MPPAPSGIPRRFVGPTPAPSRRMPAAETPIGQIRPIFNNFDLADASWDGDDTTLPSLPLISDLGDRMSASTAAASTSERPTREPPAQRPAFATSVSSRSHEQDDLYLRRIKGPKHSSTSTSQRRAAVTTPSQSSTYTPPKPLPSLPLPLEAVATPDTSTPRAEAAPLTLPPSVSVRRYTRRRAPEVTTSERVEEAPADVGSAHVEPEVPTSERADDALASGGATRTVTGGGLTRAERAALAAAGGPVTSQFVRKNVPASFVAALGAKPPADSTGPARGSSSERQRSPHKSTSPLKDSPPNETSPPKEVSPLKHASEPLPLKRVSMLKRSLPTNNAKQHRATPSRLSQIDMGAVLASSPTATGIQDAPSTSFEFMVPFPPRSPRPQANRSVLAPPRYASPALSDATLPGSAMDWDMSVRTAATASPTKPDTDADVKTVPPKEGGAETRTAGPRATRRRSVIGQFVDGIFGGAADVAEDSDAEPPMKRRRSSTLAGRIYDGIFGGNEVSTATASDPRAEQAVGSVAEQSTEETATRLSNSHQPPAGPPEPAPRKPRLVPKGASSKVSRPVKRGPSSSALPAALSGAASSASGPLRPAPSAAGPLRPTAASLARTEERRPLASRGAFNALPPSTKQRDEPKPTVGVQPRKRKFEATTTGHSSRAAKAPVVPARSSHSSTQAVLARLAKPSRPTSAAQPVKLRDAERARDLELRRQLWERRAAQAANAGSSAGPSDGGRDGAHTPPPSSSTPLVDMNERRAMFDRPRANDSRAPPRNKGLELTVPIRGHTPGKASRRRAEKRAAFDSRVAAQMAKRDADAAEDARMLDEINAEMVKKERQEKVVWAKPVPEMYRRG